jgi:hypothetical protein
MKQIKVTFACHFGTKGEPPSTPPFSTLLPFPRPLPSTIDRTPSSCKFNGWDLLRFQFEETYPSIEPAPPVPTLVSVDCVQRDRKADRVHFYPLFRSCYIIVSSLLKNLYIDVHLAEVTFNLTFTVTSTSQPFLRLHPDIPPTALKDSVALFCSSAMDLAARIEERYLEDGSWSQTASVHPRASKQSVHRSQLDSTNDKIQRLNIANSDGSTIDFEGSECEQSRLGFTGGTDDPSIELSLRQFSSDPWTAQCRAPTIIYKYTAFAHSETDFVRSSFRTGMLRTFQLNSRWKTL